MPNIFLPPLCLGRAIGLAVPLALLMLAGCAHVKPAVPEQPTLAPPGDPYARSDLDELLGFGADLDGATPADRAEVCRALRKRQQGDASQAVKTGIQLHLLTARLFSARCGDIPAILTAVDAMTAQDLPDGKVRQWVAVQTQALTQMDRQSKKLTALVRKQKPARREPGNAGGPGASNMTGKPKAAKSSHDHEGEARALREKLEAIQSMEERLDSTGEGS